MAIEDFTAYTETDSGSDLTVTASKVAVATMLNAAVSHVVKDAGAGHFGNFEHLVKGTFSASSGNRAQVLLWSASNNSNPTHAALLTANVGDSLRCYRWGTATQIHLYEYSTDVSDDFDIGDVAITRWFTIERASTTLTCKIYSNATRTTLVDTLSIVCATTTYRYISPCGSLASADYAVDWTLDVEDLDLQEAVAFVPKIFM